MTDDKTPETVAELPLREGKPLHILDTCLPQGQEECVWRGFVCFEACIILEIIVRMYKIRRKVYYPEATR